MRKKLQLVNVLSPKLCAYWHHDQELGRVVIYTPDKYSLTAAQVNWMLDMAKLSVLQDSEKMPK